MRYMAGGEPLHKTICPFLFVVSSLHDWTTERHYHEDPSQGQLGAAARHVRV